MSQPSIRTKRTLNSISLDLPLLPAASAAVLCLGAAIHQNPTLLRPVLSLAHLL